MAYVGISGKARKAIDVYIGVYGRAERAIKGYIGDENNVAQLWWQSYRHIMLAPRNEWYKGTTERSKITRINIVDSYDVPAGIAESWNADVLDSGTIKCYIKGTHLIICGNGEGHIYANFNSTLAFAEFINVTTITGLKLLDTSYVETMASMFYRCLLLEELDLSSFITTNVVWTDFMFQNCVSLKQLNISTWDISSLKYTTYMFEGTGFEVLDLSHLDFSNVANIEGMFRGCNSLISIAVPINFGAPQAAKIFSNCTALTTLDLTSWKMYKVQDLDYAFYNCSSMTAIYISADTEVYGITDYTFYKCGVSGFTRVEEVD